MKWNERTFSASESNTRKLRRGAGLLAVLARLAADFVVPERERRGRGGAKLLERIGHHALRNVPHMQRAQQGSCRCYEQDMIR